MVGDNVYLVRISVSLNSIRAALYVGKGKLDTKSLYLGMVVEEGKLNYAS